MAFRITYKRLFEVELRQNYCLNQGATEFAALTNLEQDAMLAAYRKSYDWLDDFVLSIPEETRRTMAGLGMLCKTTSAGFFVATEVEETTPGTFTPKRAPDAPLRLRFALRLKTAAFMNYTNLSLAGNARKIYYLSNHPSEANRTRAEGSQRTFPFLSIEPPAHQANTDYRAGDVVRRAELDDVLYLSKNDGQHAVPDVNPAANDVWLRLDGVGYVNRNDRVSLYAPLFNFPFPPATVAEAQFTVTDVDDASFFYAVDADGNPFFGANAGDRTTFAADAGATLSHVQLDLRALPAGRYRISVEGLDSLGDPYSQTEEVYLDAELATQNIFGLIEVVHLAGSALGSYRLLNGDDELLQPFYHLHFLNRYTFWRYLFKTAPTSVPDAADFEAIGGDSLEYVTRAPFPLTKSFTELNDADGNLLPNPSARLIRPEDDGRVYSEVYLLHN